MDGGARIGPHLQFVQATRDQQEAIERLLNGQHPSRPGGALPASPQDGIAGRGTLVSVLFVWSDAGTGCEPATPRLAERCSFRPMTDWYWKVVYAGGEFPLDRALLGSQYLNYLLHHPNIPISAFDLEIAVSPEKALARRRNSIQTGIDEAAARNYLRELDRLRAAREVASAEGNHAEVEQIDDALEQIGKELKKRKRSVDTGERARGNVRKAINAVCRRLMSQGPHERAFAQHIKDQVSLGFEVLYTQPPGTSWA